MVFRFYTQNFVENNLKDKKRPMEFFDNLKFIISYEERCDWLVKFTSLRLCLVYLPLWLLDIDTFSNLVIIAVIMFGNYVE